MKKLLAFGAVLALYGCQCVGPDYCPSKIEEPEAWIEQENELIHLSCSDKRVWWESFNDPTLSLLIRQAYGQNLSLQAAATRIAESRAQLAVARGNLFPQQQNVQGSYTRSRNSADDVPTGGSGVSRSSERYRLSTNVSWELDFWGGIRRGVEAASAEHCASIATYDALLVLLTAQVAETYITVRQLEELIRVAKENIAIQERSYEIVGVLYRNGATTELDYRQASALLKATQAEIPELEHRLRIAQNSLSVLLGELPGQVYTTLDLSSGIPITPSEIVVGIPANLIRRRPDLRAAEYTAIAQSARIGVAKAALYPHFSLFGSIGLTSRNAGDLFSSSKSFYQYGPSFQWNLLNYDRLKSAVKVQDARFEQLLLNYRQQVIEAYAEVENALSAYLRRSERLPDLREAAKDAQRASDLAMLQYKESAVPYTRVLDTQEVLLAREAAVIDAEAALAIGLITTYKAMGGGWQLQFEDGRMSNHIKREMKCRTDWDGLLDQKDCLIPYRMEECCDE